MKAQAEAVAHPEDPDAHFNLGLAYQLEGKNAQALPEFEAAVSLAPDDWHSVAKLIQINQALGQLGERDRRRTQLLEMYRAGKVVNPKMDVFCREQTVVGKNRVMVMESFELKGDRAVRYTFNVIPDDGTTTTPAFLISLGSYEWDQAVWRREGKLGPGERVFHLDGYWPDGSHATYGFFKGEPSYDDVRKIVFELLAHHPG